MIRNNNNSIKYSFKKFIYFFVADAHVIDTEYRNETFNSFDHLNNSYSDIPYEVSMPDTPMQSDCESICAADAVSVRDDDIYDAYFYESFELPSTRRGSTISETATVLPRIVITPTPDDDALQRRTSLTNASPPFYGIISEEIASNLNELNRDATEINIARDDKTFIGDAQKITNSMSGVSSIIENNSNEKLADDPLPIDEKELAQDSNTESESEESESEESEETESDEESEPKEKIIEHKRSDSLVAVKSVKNIQVYDENDSESSENEVESIQDMEQNDIEDHQNSHEGHNLDDSDDESADIIEFIMDHGPESEANSIHFDDHLSVIYEEVDERTQGRRTKLDSMCSSNSSATLANDEKTFESDTETVESDHDQDSDSLSVTVRLPLRLSFSRSENNEEITTVEIGKSEIEIEDNSCHTPGLIESESDVSVSFSLKQPKSNPNSRPISLDVPSFDDDDSEVSVSISLPRRNRTLSPAPFVRQQTLSPVPHSADAFEYKPWSFGSSIDESFEQESFEVMNDPQNEERAFSVRDHIAAFESAQGHREELQRQNACVTSDSEEEEEEDDDGNEINEVALNDYSSIQNQTKSQFYPIEDTNYDSFVSVTYQANENEAANQTTAVEQAIDMKQEHQEEEVDQANLSVQAKIASFEQPLQSQYKQIDARREIYALRQASQTADEVQCGVSTQPEYIRSESIRSTNSSIMSTPQPQLQNKDFDIQTALQPNSYFDRNNFMQRSIPDESELDEDDSGVLTDPNRRTFEETDTESEYFPELRKLTRYERAATHSRLFKFLQEYEGEANNSDKQKADEDMAMFTRPKKIIHNVSITRKQNPDLIKNAETMAERRERLSLSHVSSSIDADNPSTSASPTCSSPTPSVNEKLIDELVQSALQQAKRRNMRNIPIEKIQAAARRALQQQDENDSCDTTFSSFDSTPALTPQEFNDECYDSETGIDILPSKAFKNLQEQSVYGRKRKLWAARCPRVLSSKTVNSDLSRVTETRESQTPERDQQSVSFYH